MRITTLIAITLLLTKAGLSAASLLAIDLRPNASMDLFDKRLARLLDEGVRDRAERLEAGEKVGTFAIFLHLREAAAIVWSVARRFVHALRHHLDEVVEAPSVSGTVGLSFSFPSKRGVQHG
ncbi:hypothetical protein HFQ13_10450 [Acidithiobacillus sp. VAN18-1]|uniref:Uncharacterized protein n=1 Tax=Igneacidithiobacillus copahuensis TaxID=2724909 RepID=A0AAE2YRT5_9PROT|nr:hypothetical protein [Igneacidithiobacillus copahuensis]MBU2788610.1 hypothetical protein [Igneacidithiobacillus copahuensis]MBU2796706.1 hypothetical protein [Acidithiobacillus sp. VAN18-2]